MQPYPGHGSNHLGAFESSIKASILSPLYAFPPFFWRSLPRCQDVAFNTGLLVRVDYTISWAVA